MDRVPGGHFAKSTGPTPWQPDGPVWGGVQSREVYCVHGNDDITSYPNPARDREGFKLRKREIVNEPTGGAGSCPHLVEAIPCDEPSCYDWLVVQLEACIPDNGSCGPGTQAPQTQCVNSDGAPVERQLCRDAILPIPGGCEAACPSDCALSPWSAWSSCSHTCSGKTNEGRQTRHRAVLAYGAGRTSPWGPCIEDSSLSHANSSSSPAHGPPRGVACAIGMQTRKVICVRDSVGQVPRKSSSRKNKQSRKRIIIQPPANGGQDCPEVLSQERECEAVSVCVGFRWKTHKWRRCQLLPWAIRQDSPGAQESCGPGLQTRAVSCRKQDGGQADIRECLRLALPMPPVTQPCQLPCQDDCQLSAWSRFSSCTSDCGGVQTRKRALMGAAGQGDQRECGQGHRYQAVACYNQDQRLVETERCSSHGYIEEACVRACPSDCKLSEWSHWSRCSKSCGSGVKVRSKWLREKPYNGGRPCPKLDHVSQVYEVVPCVSDCSQYVWVAEPWSMWKVSSVDLKENCGEGVQTRKVRCVQNTVDGPGEPVEDYLCDPEEMPLGARESRLPCPGDCVLSDWGSWSRCAPPCNGNGTRERTASPIRPPGEGKACPPSTQSEPCRLNTNCYHYSYNITDWSTCQLSERAVCGRGIKTRMLDCVRSDGKSVDLKYCEELGLHRKWLMNSSCRVECPVNCQLSDWSAWSQCSLTCGLSGRMMRRRSVTQASQGDGRPCPAQMEQWKPCPVKPCYRWSFSPWSECGAEDAGCGEGVRVRNVSCVVFDGSHDDEGGVVEEELCGGAEPLQEGGTLEEPCTVPCPGDCYLAEWSGWSSCERSCVGGVDLGLGAVQVRSRPPVAQEPDSLSQCPEQEWESRPCTEGQCYEYTWMTSEWNGHARQVWCQRSDGLNVTGGCPQPSRPPSDRSCDPACDTPRSVCTEVGVCGCEEGYTEVLSSDGLLDQCTLIPVLEIPTAGVNEADVKTIRAAGPTLHPGNRAGRAARTWFLQPFGP
ncbi:hypothetical protein COCON_G00125240, partial [Conger conger]